MTDMALKNIYDVVVIGSGPGGLAAAVAAKKEGAQDVLIIERDLELGGILVQCIHNGFGLETFKEDLPGPTYAQRFIKEAQSIGVEALLDAMVLDITPQRKIYVTTRKNGFIEIESRSIVLAMGCRERTRPQIQIPEPVRLVYTLPERLSAG
jgi:NADPH-dependent 2,4-dienoyl-CoA reductase/sulfur reductase-like enzyme